MRTLIIHSYFHPIFDNKIEGGIETHTSSLYHALNTSGHDVTIACTSDSQTSKKSIIIDNVCKDRFEGKMYPHLKGYEEVIKTIGFKEFDLVIINNTSPNIIKAISNICKVSGTTCITFVHGVPGGMGIDNYIEALNSSDAVFAVSHFLANKYRSLGCTRDIKVIHSTFSEIGGNVVTTPRDNSLVFFGRLVQVRNLMDAIHFIKNSREDYTLDLIGEGVNHPVEVSYLEKARELTKGDSRFKFWGRLPQDEAYDIISECQVMLNLCPVEAFGLAAFETQKLGVPVVYSYKGINNMPGPSEFVIEDVTGASFDTYGVQIGKRTTRLENAIERAKELDREEIFDLFSKFGIKKYRTDINKSISEVCPC